jgi:L-fuculose-phosphate aldolase
MNADASTPPTHAPAAAVAEAMRRIYDAGLTTTSGGNVSTRADDGRLWITPAGLDKGGLTAEAVAVVAADGSAMGTHRPSSELPFHREIYRRRPDLRALVHAHPPGLVALSICRQKPELRLLAGVAAVCGEVGFAPYELTGSAALGERIADVFASGANVVVLENHGVVVGGRDLDEAVRRFELAEHCAQVAIKAASLGPARPLERDRDQTVRGESSRQSEPIEGDGAIREELAALARRAARHKLAQSGLACFSARGRNDETDAIFFTPPAADCVRLKASDVQAVRLRAAAPSNDTLAAHVAVYKARPEVGAIVSAAPSHLAAFCVTGETLDTRTIPESFILLREVAHLPASAASDGGETLARTLSLRRPAALAANIGAVVVGRTPLEAFDRLEVLESTARSLLEARALGEISPMSRAALEALARAFSLEDA